MSPADVSAVGKEAAGCGPKAVTGGRRRRQVLNTEKRSAPALLLKPGPEAMVESAPGDWSLVLSGGDCRDFFLRVRCVIIDMKGSTVQPLTLSWVRPEESFI